MVVIGIMKVTGHNNTPLVLRRSNMLRTKIASLAPGLGQRAASAIALKYSSAVYGAALAKSPAVLNKVHAELAAVSSTIAGDAELTTFIHNPTLSANDRKAGLTTLYSRLEAAAPKKESVSEITKNLLGVLSENGRLAETQGVIEGFNELVEKYRGELTVVVTSATPLPKDVLSRLETALKQSQTGQKAKVLKVTNKVRRFPFFSASALTMSAPHRSTRPFSAASLSTLATRPLISASSLASPS
jgi:F-type H+-transporting ATPase subunit O